MPLAMLYSMRAVTWMLPPSLAARLIDIVADSATALITSNRGPSEGRRLGGRNLQYYVSWAPQRASVGICITLWTFAGTMRCSVSADETCVPRPEELVALYDEAFSALAEMAGCGCGEEDA